MALRVIELRRNDHPTHPVDVAPALADLYRGKPIAEGFGFGELRAKPHTGLGQFGRFARPGGLPADEAKRADRGEHDAPAHRDWEAVDGIAQTGSHCGDPTTVA